VEVHGGVVTLMGVVDSWTARLAAQEAAHRVAGVLDVANDLQVKLPGSRERDDTDIARAVRQALEWDVTVPDERIRTTVSNGVVTLEGAVDFWSEHDDAARAVRNLAGVREVKNLLTVEPPAVTRLTVEKAIDEALERHTVRAARHVKIEVEGDTVKLTGEVPSWAERAAVEGAVRGTRGVRRVESTLRIHP
jgi:osmotically-inducible protein OsmY